MRAALDEDVDPRRDVPAVLERGEEGRVEEEFLLHPDGAVDRLQVAAAAAELDGGVQAADGAQVADVAHEQRPARREQPHRLADDVLEVGGAREVLHHRVDHDGVEVVLGQAAGVVRRPAGEPHGRIRPDVVPPLGAPPQTPRRLRRDHGPAWR
ncbi:hypothetical protein [Actinomadura madurae]|uniref:hypothetical protein n=1 Tax=Actinomadura madurae TaxID=1993 RepID=UPI0035583525